MWSPEKITQWEALAGEKNFVLASASRPALGRPQAPVQWVPGDLSPGGKAAGT
jgi:hypothetical protein